MQKTVVLVGAMDTKAVEISFAKKQIEQRGCRAIILDFSVGMKPAISGDISCEEVAKAGGGNNGEIWGNPDRVKKNKIITDGAIKKVQELYESGDLDGIMCIGGAGGTLIGTNIMKALPFGVPKLVVSSNAGASGFAHRYFGTKDITMMHTVVDIAGISEMLEILLTQAAGAICGMVEALGSKTAHPVRNKPSIALCELMIEAGSINHLRQLLEANGFQVSVFMATGVGDTAMEELIAEGRFDAVIDLSTGGIVDSIIGGTRAACPNRLETAGERGIPQIVAPGGLDFIAPPRSKYKPEYEMRKSYQPDALRRLLRSNVEELTQAARIIAAKLNKAKGPVKFLVPMKGWSTVSGTGRPLDDQEADLAFVAELRKQLNSNVEIREVNARIDEPSFADAIISTLQEIM